MSQTGPETRPEDFSVTLTDATSMIEVAEWRATNDDFGFSLGVPVEITKKTLHGGRQEGSTLIVVKAGDLSVTVVPTRGMGLYKAAYGGVEFGWKSPVDEIVNPAFIRLGERNGLGWLEGFNELMIRCGYEWSGHPAGEFTLHGRAGNIPASKVTVTVEHAAPHRIVIRGLIKEKAFKQADFETWTSLIVEPGKAGFTVADRLTNLSDYERPYQALYHTNFGRPLLEKEAKVLAPITRIAPFNDGAKPGLATWDTYLGPTKGFDEMVYACELAADADGKTMAVLVNASATLGVAMSYDVTELPAFTLWKNTDTERQGYVTGLEPGTNYPYARVVEQKHGRLKTLASGASQDFRIDIDLLTDPVAVARASARVDALRPVSAPVVESEPVFLNER